MSRGLLWMTSCIVLAGCSAVYSTDDAREDIPLTLSRPVVRITPGSPTASDDLAAVIITESEDPAGQEITYEYVWLVEDEVRATGANVPGALTNVGETWKLVVTPHAGAHYGKPGTATVLIGEPAAIPAPTAHIVPAEPDTTMDFRVVIDGESVDSEGGAVTYDYAWTLNDAPNVTTSGVPADATTRGQVWRVTITPRSGIRIGVPLTLSITIANAPPVIGTVGFSRYRPITTDRLQVFPGNVHDPDGDAVTFTYEWIRNETQPIAGETTDSTYLSERGFVAVDTVRVLVTPHDADDAGEVARSPLITVSEPQSSWRQLMPNRYSQHTPGYTVGSSGMTLDRDDERLVYVSTFGLWEMPLDGPRRYVELPFEGVAPELSSDGVFVDDPENDRLFVVEHGHVFRLDLDRGAERWSRLTETPLDPVTRHATAFLDDARDRLVLAQNTLHRGVFVFPLAGDGTWHPLTITSEEPGGVGSGWLHEAGADVAYLVGGADGVGTELEMTWEGSRTDVWVFDIVAATFTRLDASPMPAGTAWPSVAIDPVSRKAYVMGGATDLRSVHFVEDDDYYRLRFFDWNDDTYTFDFATRTWTTLPRDASSHFGRVLGTATWDEKRARVLDMTGLRNTAFRSDVYAVAADGSRTAVDVGGTHVPLPVCNPGFTNNDRGLVIVGGTTLDDELTSDVWMFNFVTDAFEKMEVAPDPTAGRPPAAADVGRTSARTTPQMYFAGFPSEVVGVFDTWMLDFDTTPWSWTKIGGTPTPDEGLVRPSPRAYRVRMESRNMTIALGQIDAGGAAAVWTKADGSNDWVYQPVGLAPGTTEPPEYIEDGVVVAPYSFGSDTLRLIVNPANRQYIYELRYDDGFFWKLRPQPDYSPAYASDPIHRCHAGVIDGDRVIMFGGFVNNDVWEYDIAR